MRLNVTARAARWSAAHWKTATLLWLAFVVAAVALGAMAGKKNLTDAESSNGETARAETMLAQAGFKTPSTEAVFVQSRTGSVAGETRTVMRRLRQLSQVAHVHRSATAQHGRAALVEFDLTGDPDNADTQVQPVLKAVAALQKQAPRLTVAEYGEASVDQQTSDKIGSDLGKAEKLSLPITFVILLLAFGAFVAAGIPVLLAISAVLASLGLDALSSHVWHTADPAASVIVLIGMAVGVDYSLFYVKREREERRRGHGEDALIRAASTSGMAVLVSGGTVLIAMAGMLFAGSSVFTALGIASMLVVAVAVIGSLTVLPALLGKLGDRIERGVLAVAVPRWRSRRTIIQRLKGERDSSRLWDAVLRPVLRHPWLASGIALWALVVLALPAFTMHTKLPGAADLPKSIPSVAAFDRANTVFPGTQVPLELVVKAPNVDAPAVVRQVANLRREALATGLMVGPVTTSVNPAHTVAQISLPVHGNGEDTTSNQALSALRNAIVPRTVGRLPNVEHAVTGDTAGDADFNTAVKHHAPYVFAFVLGLAFLLLLATFRSVVVPLTAIALNLLSVGAAYGVLVWIFQDGHLQSELGYHSNGGVVTWLPLFLFAILFALSMDYHVFIVSRIKELVDGGMSTADAVSTGIRTTAGTVTSAAAVMVAVFALFASLSSLDIKQMGTGLAVAVLLDATIIRGVLLPATMKILGRANWYLPRALGWLPELKAEAAA
ncbi:MAG TPA: MMPL family transporter [Gaiellaceae bacterium]|nr:MMPL family transporter [Gaiellaceae bacterium]